MKYLKLGLIQTLSRLCSPRPNFGRNADWLLEQCYKIWLAVGINGSWKRLFLAWLFSRMISRRRREGSIFVSFLLFYGLIVGKYALICVMEIQKIQIVVHIFSGFALFTGTNVSVSQSWISASCWPRTMCRMYLVIYQQTSANPTNTIHVKTVFIWKFTSLNGVLKRRLTTKETSVSSVTNCKVSEVLQLLLDEKYHIAFQRISCRHYYTLVALVLTDLLFAFAFCN